MEHKYRVLVLQEDPARHPWLPAIERAGYAVVSAAFSADLAETLHSQRPATVLLEAAESGERGLEACRRVKSVGDCRTILVAVGAAGAPAAERVRYYQAGADDFLESGADPGELLAKLQVYSGYRSAAELEQMKSDLLALLNHETRTPLHGILSALQMLMGHSEPSEARRQEWLTLAFDNAVRVGSLLEKALLLGSLRSGVVEFSPEWVDLEAMAEETVQEVLSAAKARQVGLHISSLPGARALVDPEKTRLVLAILLDNAVRHAPPGTPVELRVSAEREEIRLAVTDRGAGIPTAVQARLFDPLGDPDVDHHGGGHWLSLPLAHEIMTKQGGRIDVDSGPERGSTLTLSFPRSARLESNGPEERERAA